MAMDDKHRAIVGEIQRLIQIYYTLPPEVKKEIMRFLKTPEMLTEIRFKNSMAKNKKNLNMKIINYYVV
ncbi:MAG: hypothetical protein PHV30_03090 [Candidatus Margulisbacteria bacterium]|nr:hypothetical protein [Candidatus Margulisiibacteriota bacterium]